MGDYRSQDASFDEAIDRAVREMMDVDARPGFERRVMRRLGEQRPPSLVWPRVAGAAAVLATILVVVLVPRDTPERQTAPNDAPASTMSSSQPSAEAPKVPTVARPTPSTTATEKAGRATRSTRSGGVVVASGTRPSRDEDARIPTIAALQPPAELAVEDIHQPAVDMTDIAVSTIEIPQLHVEALGPLDGRSRE